MTRRTKYSKSLTVLAETNGMSISTLEKRLRLGMSIKDALNTKTRSKEVTKQDLLLCNHLTFSKACLHLNISSRKLNRLSKMYDVYFMRTSYTQNNESKVIVWCALHSPILTIKHMARFVTNQLCFDVSESQIKYRLSLFGFTLKNVKSNVEHCQQLMFKFLWTS